MNTYGSWELVMTSVANGFVWVCSECGYASIKKKISVQSVSQL